MSRCRSCEPVGQEVRVAADLLERRWLIQVVVAAHSGAVRFNEFGSAVVGISPRMLSSRLRDLERAPPQHPGGAEWRRCREVAELGPGGAVDNRLDLVVDT